MKGGRTARPGEVRYPSLHDMLRSHAQREPEAPAILSPDRKPLTYFRLYQHLNETMKTLRSAGIRQNDRVALVMPPGPEAAVATLAVSAGATCVPLNPDYRAGEFELYLADLDCGALIVPEENESPAEAVAEVHGIPVLKLLPVATGEAGIFSLGGEAPARSCRSAALEESNDIALVLHTSGTSARPKQVPLTHRNICAAACSILDAVALGENDRCLAVMPLFHIHGLSAVFSSIAAGGSVVCMGEFSTEEFFRCMHTFRPTWYTAAPAIHGMILGNLSSQLEIPNFSELRFIRSASSAMPHNLKAGLEHAFQVPVIEAYGMTEAGPQVSSNRLFPSTRKPGSVGRPAGTEVTIMDEAGGFMPPGEIGEIVIRGPSVIRAYRGRPEDNANAFIGDWLRTGDLGYLDSDGDLFIIGRLKEVINRGGEKISPAEVEEVLNRHPAVDRTVVFSVPHPTLGEDVAAGVVLRPEAAATETELRRFTLTHLAPFKVPRLVTIVDDIPLGSSGKPNRRDLAIKLGLMVPVSPDALLEPMNEIERRVAKIWASVLDTQEPGRHANFFQHGGHSLSAIRVLARYQREFGVVLGNDLLFARPTVAEQAEAISLALARNTESPPFAFQRHTREAPLSFSQERLWFLDQLEPGNPAYNISAPLRLSGPLDRGALERSIREIQRRHETLRTRFIPSDRDPIQVIDPLRDDIPSMEFTLLPPGRVEKTALELATEDAGRPFDLAAGPLLRASLVQLSPEEHLLLITLHHIIADRWSIGVLFRELGALYATYAAGRTSPLPELSMQYGDFAVWQRKRLQGRFLDEQLDFWKRQLEKLPPAVELPSDRPRPEIQTYSGARVSHTIPEKLTRRLKELSSREDATLFMTTMAAFQTLLMRCTGQEDLLVGIPIANRTRLETETMIGFFANTLVFRGNLTGDPPFRKLLGRVKEYARAAYAHQDLPFEKLVETLHPHRDSAATPLFRIMFAFQNVPDAGTGPFELSPGLTARPLSVNGGASKFDLTVYLQETGHGLHTTWQYNSDLFQVEAVECLARLFQKLLDEIAKDSTRPLSEIPLLTETDRRLVQAQWRPSSSLHLDGGLFHRLFERQVEQTPDAVALDCDDISLSYRSINNEANRLARHLIKLGLAIEDRVAIVLPRSSRLILAVLGVLKAGGTYIALDPKYPWDRLSAMMSDSRPSFMITETFLSNHFRTGKSMTVVHLDTDQELISGEGTDNLEDRSCRNHLAYILYTSGSTGPPKGVMITHTNLCHCARAMGSVLGVVPGDRYLHTASFGFSSSVRQLAVPLCCGATVVLASSESIRDPQMMMTLIKEKRISIIDLVPSHLRICLQELKAMAPEVRIALVHNDLRLILSASEPLSQTLSKEWLETMGQGARLVNMYGQTETTGIVATHKVKNSSTTAAGGVPIGKAIPDMRVYVLDRAGKPVPPGVLGEMYAAGAGVGKGYLNSARSSEEKFLPDPFFPEDRMCRTGDIARLQHDGTLEFIGRSDDQIKIRGYRIEPGEIEVILNRHSQVCESAVMADTQFDPPQLMVYVVPSHAPGPPGLEKELRSFLKGRLPDYMLPNTIVKLDRLPRTVTGKVERNVLFSDLIAKGIKCFPETSPAAEFVTPRTPAEQVLAEIWRKQLNVAHIGVEDNYFDLGGDSLLSVQMIHLANEAGLPISLKQFFQYQTVAELARVANDRPDFSNTYRRSSRFTESSGHKIIDRESMVYVAVENLRAYGREALEKVGLAPEGAAIVTEVQLEASLREQPTHNMDSIPRYARQLLSGALTAKPNIRIEHGTRMSSQIDGGNGPGQWVASVAMETAIEKALQSGIGVVSVRRSNHFGAAGHYVWLAARRGLIGLCTTNGPVILSPWGGTTPTFGNNPVAAGIPTGKYSPVILDVAMSVAPRGKIGLQLAEGRPLAPGWILDRFGRPSVNPEDLAAGLGVPIGGHKGYGLALVMEALSGVLSGAGFCLDHRKERMKDASKPRDIGHFFMAIDPELFSPADEFLSRMDRLVEQTKASAPMEGTEEILIPGEAEMRARNHNINSGVPLRPVTFRSLVKYGRYAGLDTRLVALQK